MPRWVCADPCRRRSCGADIPRAVHLCLWAPVTPLHNSSFDNGSSRKRADQASKPQPSCPTAAFSSAADRPVLPLSFRLRLERDHAHDGGARRWRRAARMARTIGPVTARCGHETGRSTGRSSLPALPESRPVPESRQSLGLEPPQPGSRGRLHIDSPSTPEAGRMTGSRARRPARRDRANRAAGSRQRCATQPPSSRIRHVRRMRACDSCATKIWPGSRARLQS